MVGAGPTGLVLALFLARRGVACRIVDRSEASATTSRAMVVHARTLELYRQLDLAERCVAAGAPIDVVRLRVEGVPTAEIGFGAIGEGMSPYPFALSLPQDRHERILETALNEAGLAVERGTVLKDLLQSEAGIIAELGTEGGHFEQVRPRYVVGCDGFHSTVRSRLGLAMEGGTYSQRFFVADVQASGNVPASSIVVSLGSTEFFGQFSLPVGDAARLIGTLPAGAEEDEDAAVQGALDRASESLGLRIHAKNWVSAYRVHHRVAARFALGRAFLAGDAAHVHSPAGGQGMNTGIGDAVNLAWKLAAVLRDGADEALLETYEAERRPFAVRLVQTTDRAFAAAVDDGAVARTVRLRVLPRLWPRLLRLRPVRRMVFRLISQIAISYRKAGAGWGRLGPVSGGDRMPWCGSPENWTALSSGSWHVQAFGLGQSLATSPDVSDLCSDLALPLHAFDLTGTARVAGLRAGLYLVRPDGHVVCAARNAHALRAMLAPHLGMLGLGRRS